ncbi:hypothetical protein L0Y59_01590, partial [Candidatus Uhrbacteria bacterium]|nr:hypothetical protein [Candidatus Uhrbacteria bacterium]
MRTPLFLLSLSAFVLFGAGCTVDPPPTAALIKASGPAVYSFADGKRYSFPNEAVYFSWSEDFEDVKTVSDATLASLPLAGNVTFRPGTLLKIETDPKVYVVDRMNRIRWISSEELAVALFGEAWAKSVHDVSDALFTGYVVDTPVASEEDETSFDDPPDDYHSLLFDLRSESRKDTGKTLPHMTSFSFTESSEYHYAATTTATDEEVWAWVDSLSNGWTEQYEFDQSDASS